MIKFDAVRKVYPDGTVAVDDLTLEVPEGTLAAFVGPSGCGKTTSMRMINRMIDPSAGKLTVDGNDVTKVDPVQLRLGIGYVIQSAGLMPHLKVIDNVATVPVLKGESRAQCPQGCARRPGAGGAGSEVGQPLPAQLSGGQQQRVGVARALAADPPILLMDEPFSAVDPVVREELQTEILRLQSELARRSCSSRTTSTRRSSSARRSRCSAGVACSSSTTRPPGCCRIRPTTSSPDSSARIAVIGGCSFFHATGLPLHDVRTVGEPGIDSMVLDPGEWPWSPNPTAPRTRGSTPAASNSTERKFVVRQQHCRWFVVPAERHAASGARRRTVLACRTGGGGRRGRPGDRRGEGRRRAGGAGGAAHVFPGRRRGLSRELPPHASRRRLGVDGDPTCGCPWCRWCSGC